MDTTIFFRTLRWSLGIASAAALFAACAEGQVDFEDDGSNTNDGGTVSDGGMGGTVTTNPCGQDCSAIQTPPCYQSVCNDGSPAIVYVRAQSPFKTLSEVVEKAKAEPNSVQGGTDMRTAQY